MEEDAYDEAHDGEKVVAPALLALDPLGKFVVVAVGSQLRVYNLLYASKKVSAAAFSSDSEWLLYADKFGVVYAVTTKFQEDLSVSPAVIDQPVNLLAHCCSIITSLKCTADAKYLVTADRDFKIRVSVFPKNPLLGAHEIEGFCLGHTSFVSCIAFVGDALKLQLLVSGGGDGTVRLWEIESARLLDTVDVGTTDRDDETVAPLQASSITCVSVSPDGVLIAVGMESFDGVTFLECDTSSKRLKLLKKIGLAKHFCPTSMEFDNDGMLWLVAGGAQKISSSMEKAVSWVKAVSCTLGDAPVFTPMELESLPGGRLLLEALDGTDSDSSKALALAEAANVAVKNELSKRNYTHEQREFRKRMRNDKKLQKHM